jgi:hypothetical protein
MVNNNDIIFFFKIIILFYYLLIYLINIYHIYFDPTDKNIWIRPWKNIVKTDHMNNIIQSQNYGQNY